MTFPIEALSGGLRGVGLAFAIILGIGFGLVLERGGLGNTKKLVGQFHGTDMTVLKVMFTAVVTTMLGVVVLSRVGVFDLAAAQANYPTFLWPQIAGGLLVGAGFATSGYCPGTSVVGAASGKLDALATVGGVALGGVLNAELERSFGAFTNSGKLGPLSLSTWLGIPAPIIAVVVVIVAIAAFVAGERIERIMGGSAEGPPSLARKAVFGTLIGLAVLAVATLALPTGTAAAP